MFFRLQLELYQSAKFYLSIQVTMNKAIGEEEIVQPFRSPASELLQSTNVDEEVLRHINILGTAMDQFVRNGRVKNFLKTNFIEQVILVIRNPPIIHKNCLQDQVGC